MSGWREETIGDCRLILGDCREVLAGLTFDAIVSDPPYGIGHRRGACNDRGKGLSLGSVGIMGDAGPFDPRHLLSRPALLWGANYYAGALSRGRWLVWDKLEHGGSGDFSQAEIGWCSVPGPTLIFRHMWLGVQRASEVGEQRQHPTQKPVALMIWCLGLLPSGVVCDPYMGSGTTGLACIKARRSFIGIEIDPAHFATACRRIEAAHRQADLFVERPTARPEQAAFDLGLAGGGK